MLIRRPKFRRGDSRVTLSLAGDWRRMDGLGATFEAVSLGPEGGACAVDGPGLKNEGTDCASTGAASSSATST